MRLHIKTPTREFDYTARDGASSIVIGNRKYDDVCIEDDPALSGPHVRIEQFIGKWSFSDQFSNAGTVHNGAKKNSGELARGDVLQLGATLVTVAALDSAAQPQSSAVADDVAPAKAVEFKVDSDDLSAEFKADWPEALTKQTEAVEADLHEEPAEKPEAKEPAPEAIRDVPLPATYEPGSVFEQRIVALLVSRFRAEHGLDPSRDGAAMKRIVDAARKAVVELESSRTSGVNLPFLMADNTGPKHLQVEVQRKHLHERAPDEAVPHRVEKSPRNQEAASAPAAKAGSKAGAVFVVMIFIVVVGAFVAVDIFEESAGTPGVADAVRERELAAEASRKAEQEIEAAVKALLAHESPETALDLAEQLAAATPAEFTSAQMRIASAMHQLTARVSASVREQYNAARREAASRSVEGDLRGAEAAVDKLERYLEESPHRKDAFGTGDMQRWMTQARTEHADANRRLLADKLPDADEALQLRDYQAAHKVLATLADGALLTSDQRTWLKAEADLWKIAAQKQAQGEIEPPLKSLPKPPALPPIPLRNDLLPAGGTQIARAASGLRNKATEALKAGTLRDVAVTYMGHKAVINGSPRGSMVLARVQRGFVGGLKTDTYIEYEIQSMLSNLPARTQLEVMLAVPNPGLEDLAGLLHHCFQNGFLDEAGKVALRIRQAAPEKKAALDEILGAKWSKPVPEGGFPERDGRVVPE